MKNSGLKSYQRIIGSRYICIREESEGQRGILVKVLGKMPSDAIKFVNGEPFCKDDFEEAFAGDRYYNYTFPTKKSLIEVLEIIHDDKSLLNRFEEAKMHINPASTFWVRECASHLMLLKKPQYYDASSNQLYSSDDNTPRYRLTIAYFYKGKLSW